MKIIYNNIQLSDVCEDINGTIRIESDPFSVKTYIDARSSHLEGLKRFLYNIPHVDGEIIDVLVDNRSINEIKYMAVNLSFPGCKKVIETKIENGELYILGKSLEDYIKEAHA